MPSGPRSRARSSRPPGRVGASGCRVALPGLGRPAPRPAAGNHLLDVKELDAAVESLPCPLTMSTVSSPRGAGATRPRRDPLEVLSCVSRLARRLDLARGTAFAEHGLDGWEFDVLSAAPRRDP